MRASARYATRTLTAPYASSPGPVTSRSPTSRCTITTYRSIGAVSNWSSSSGTETLYGRFETIDQRSAPSAVAQSVRIASETSIRTFG